MIADNKNIENLIKSTSDNLLLPVNLKRVEGKILKSNKQKNLSIIDISGKINLKQPIETIRLLQENKSVDVAKNNHGPVFVNDIKRSLAYDIYIPQRKKRGIELTKKINKELDSKRRDNSPLFKIAYNESEYGIDNYEVNHIEISNNNPKLNQELKLPTLISSLQENNQFNTVNGRILNTIKGGFSVGIAGFVGFLPYAHLHKSLSHVKNNTSILKKLNFLCGELLSFSILKAELDNIVLTRTIKNKKNTEKAQKILVTKLKHKKFVNITTKLPKKRKVKRLIKIKLV